MLEEVGFGLEEAAVRNSTIAKERWQLEGIHSKSRKAAAIPSSIAKRPQLQQNTRGRSHTYKEAAATGDNKRLLSHLQRGRSYRR
jgi:hypothetical protein